MLLYNQDLLLLWTGLLPNHHCLLRLVYDGRGLSIGLPEFCAGGRLRGLPGRGLLLLLLLHIDSGKRGRLPREYRLGTFDFHSLSDDVDGPGLNGGAVTSVGHQVVGSGGI